MSVSHRRLKKTTATKSNVKLHVDTIDVIALFVSHASVTCANYGTGQIFTFA